ncbi:MAG: hypothetical protein ACREP7_16560 [Lysobacter sp.]
MDARSSVNIGGAQIPARVHIVLARAAPTAVVIRRGPSKQVCVLGWNRRTDRVQVGQWLKGHIYERRCDLTPDGRHFIYFAKNARWSSPSRGSWTAISRAPYLKALTFLPKGDCYEGGGLFRDDREYWLNDRYNLHRIAHDDSGLRRTMQAPSHESHGTECTGIYYIRLQRDGWAMKHTDASSGAALSTFEKQLHGHWVLRKIAYAGSVQRQGRGHYYDEHALWNRRTDRLIALPDWEWAEVDGERLVWVEQGRLMAGRVDADGIVERKEIYDFNPLTWASIEAPY